jgi:hypothetical protein
MKNNEGLKNWITVDFSVYQGHPVFGIVFKTEDDAIKAMLKTEEYKVDRARIVRLSNGKTIFFVGKEVSKRKDDGFTLQGNPDLDNSEKFLMFKKALDTGLQPYMTCMFLEDGKVHPAPREMTSLLAPLQCCIQEDQDPLLFDEPSLN